MKYDEKKRSGWNSCVFGITRLTSQNNYESP